MSFSKKKIGNVVAMVSDRIPVRHGFSTRLGGVSTLPHLASLNLGENRGDFPETVAENYRLFREALSLPHKTALAKQIHSTKVYTVNEDFLKEKLPGIAKGTLPEGDGFVTALEGVTLGVKIADCLPLLLCDAKAGVIGALHGGWRGTVRGIATEGVKGMEALGAKRERIVCAIGPSIHACCFEVKEDFIDEFTAFVGSEKAKKFLLCRENRIYADLQALSADFLREAGILPEHIDIAPHCTCCGKTGIGKSEPELFFSHRASRGERGTMAAMIAL